MKIIIPSASKENIKDCLSSLFDNNPDIDYEDVIVIDDGCGTLEYPVTILKGHKPFNFSRNVNLGLSIAASENVGAVVMGDDVIQKTKNGMMMLQDISFKFNYGIMSPGIVGECGNQNQHYCERDLISDEESVLCFICVYIHPNVLNDVGLMDDEFTGYGYDDIDYCKRTMNAGYKLGVTDKVIIEHMGHSVYRSRKDFGKLAEDSRKVFLRKWEMG